MQAIFTPTRITGPLEDLFVVNAAAGEEMSMFVAHGKKAGLIFEQVYACGNNLKGSLGINRTSHLMDLTLVPDISDLFDEQDQPLLLTNLTCGRRHCLALFDYGAFLFWGENQVGQLGNRKRAFIESPYPSKKFEYRHNVENVIAGIDSSAVIVEDSGKLRKKRDKNKRKLTKDQVIKSEEELQKRAEAMMVKDSSSQQLPVSISQSVRNEIHRMLYGEKEGKVENK